MNSIDLRKIDNSRLVPDAIIHHSTEAIRDRPSDQSLTILKYSLALGLDSWTPFALYLIAASVFVLLMKLSGWVVHWLSRGFIGFLAVGATINGILGEQTSSTHEEPVG